MALRMQGVDVVRSDASDHPSSPHRQPRSEGRALVVAGARVALGRHERLRSAIEARIAYLTALLLSLPGLLASAGTDHAAVAMFACSAIALLFAHSIERIPQATVARGGRLRALRRLALAPAQSQ
jgi:hypothetical protein